MDKIKLMNPDGEEIQTDAVIQILPSILDYLNKIELRIKDKNVQLKSYNTDLEHTNLIIFDTSNIFNLIKPENFYKVFFTNKIVSALSESNYREIYFTTNVEDTHSTFPLKRLLYLSTIYLFQEVLIELNLDDLTDEIIILD